MFIPFRLPICLDIRVVNLQLAGHDGPMDIGCAPIKWNSQLFPHTTGSSFDANQKFCFNRPLFRSLHTLYMRPDWV